jgi:hypothetical protein
MGLIGWNAYNLEMEHLKHIDEHPPEFINYPHLRIIGKVINLLVTVKRRITGGEMASIHSFIRKNLMAHKHQYLVYLSKK